MSNIIAINLTSWRVLLYHRCYQSTSYIVCVDVALTKEDGSDRGIKWKLGQCDSPKTYYPELYRLVFTEARKHSLAAVFFEIKCSSFIRAFSFGGK